ncbi:MAG: response regulator [Lachnospiraceae bacterium]|nr:response regulator [Lachnospiraceae bacterium]
MKLMIVEDEQRARRGLKNIILTLSSDHEIIAEASNGKDALELIKTLKPDAVFTDIRMPYMDGLTLIREVRNLGMETKFVIISAYEEFEYARQAMTLGVTQYLVKPLIMEDIEEALEGLDKKETRKKESEEGGLTRRYPDAHPLVLRALKLIETRYSQTLNQRDLAAELGISPEYFSSLFSKNVGESFVRFLRNYRIEIAKSLYCHSDISREEVPYKVGFLDEKYYSRVFKEVTGMSVGEYIRENKQRMP